jgi:probable blue pigment (indigoidine) exporter
MVMLIAWGLIRERPRPAALAGAAVGVAGVALLVLRADFVVDPVGVAASFGAVAMSSVGFVLVKRWKPPVDLLTFTAWQLVAGGLVLLPIALLVEGPPPALDARAVGGFLYLGLVGTVLAYVVWFRGLRRLPASAVSLVGLLNPVSGTAIGILLAGETSACSWSSAASSPGSRRSWPDCGGAGRSSSSRSPPRSSALLPESPRDPVSRW